MKRGAAGAFSTPHHEPSNHLTDKRSQHDTTRNSILADDANSQQTGIHYNVANKIKHSACLLVHIDLFSDMI